MTQTPNNTLHPLKLLKEYFEDVLSGAKTFELRNNDRGFKLGDTLRLQEVEYTPNPSAPSQQAAISKKLTYTGREVDVKVTYILSDFQGLAEGFVILSVRPILTTYQDELSPTPVDPSDPLPYLNPKVMERIAVNHEAFGFGLADPKGYTTHGFEPEGLETFIRAVQLETLKALSPLLREVKDSLSLAVNYTGVLPEYHQDHREAKKTQEQFLALLKRIED